VCCLTSCSIVVHSQDVSQPPEPSFCNYIFQFPWTSFFWYLHFWPCPSMWSPTVSSGTYGELLLIFLFVWQIVAMILHQNWRGDCYTFEFRHPLKIIPPGQLELQLRDNIGHVTIRLAIGLFLLVVLWTKPLSLTVSASDTIIQVFRAN